MQLNLNRKFIWFMCLAPPYPQHDETRPQLQEFSTATESWLEAKKQIGWRTANVMRQIDSDSNWAQNFTKSSKTQTGRKGEVFIGFRSRKQLSSGTGATRRIFETFAQIENTMESGTRCARCAVETRVIRLIDEPPKKNVWIAMASAANGDAIWAVLKGPFGYEWVKRFATILEGSCKNKKPAPVIYVNTAAWLNMDDNQRVVVEDSQIGMR